MKLPLLAATLVIGLSFFQTGCVGYYPYGPNAAPPPPSPRHATVYRHGVVAVGAPAYYRSGHPYYRNPAGGYHRGPYGGAYYGGPRGPYHRGPYGPAPYRRPY